MELPYNKDDKQSIIDYAKKLVGISLRAACEESIVNHEYTGKGSFGQVLEKFYFFYEPNSNTEPDFPEVELELKSSPLKLLKNTEYRSKERLVLNIINYQNIVIQNFETSTFWKKNANLLLIFYLHFSEQNFLDYVIKLVGEWNFPNTDLEIIKKDWEYIKEKIAEGKAHELSEGDTFYLGACTKGGKGGNLRNQPNSEIQAKQRAFSLKQGYVNHIIASLSNDSKGVYGKLITTSAIAQKQTIEEIVIEKFKPYYGKSVDEIFEKVSVKINQKSKNYLALLSKAMLGIELEKEIEEFEKADIIVKTLRLKENNLPKEDISFSAFNYHKLVAEE